MLPESGSLGTVLGSRAVLARNQTPAYCAEDDESLPAVIIRKHTNYGKKKARRNFAFMVELDCDAGRFWG